MYMYMYNAKCPVHCFACRRQQLMMTGSRRDELRVLKFLKIFPARMDVFPSGYRSSPFDAAAVYASSDPRLISCQASDSPHCVWIWCCDSYARSSCSVLVSPTTCQVSVAGSAIYSNSVFTCPRSSIVDRLYSLSVASRGTARGRPSLIDFYSLSVASRGTGTRNSFVSLLSSDSFPLGFLASFSPTLLQSCFRFGGFSKTCDE